MPERVKCGLKGHYQRFCDKVGNERTNNGNKGRDQKAGVHKIVVKENQELPNGTIVARISAKVEQKTNVIGEKLNKLEKIEVSVNGQKAKGLVDSGCEISVVHKDLVPEEKLKGAGSIYLQGLFGEAVKSR